MSMQSSPHVGYWIRASAPLPAGLADFPAGQEYSPPRQVLVRNKTLISMITTDPKSTPYFYTIAQPNRVSLPTL